MPDQPRIGLVRRAAALRYEEGEMQAPQVVARGEGHIAEAIIAAARRHDIPIHQSPDLVQLLTRLPAESTIPPELYLAVAQVLVFLVRTAEAAATDDTSRAGC